MVTEATGFLWGVATSAFQIKGSPHADWTEWDPLAGGQRPSSSVLWTPFPT
jgi:beta-glucosidase/6-phospho-beta-glucosidase/beta-galactosidase